MEKKRRHPVIHTVVDQDLIRKIDEHAKKERRSRAQTARLLIEEALAARLAKNVQGTIA